MRKKGLWKVVFAATLLVLLGFAVAVVPQHTGATGTLSVHFIDVGQADSILIQTPAGKSILVDGGNNADGSLVVKYLRTHGVTSLAAVVATHPHEDHIGGLDTVINAFPVSAVYMPDVVHTSRTFEDFVQAVNASGAKRIRAKTGVTIDAGQDVTATFVAPNGTYYEDLNNYSAVLRIVFGKTAFLLAGDAEAESELEMLSKGHNLKADLLKVGHHGSSSSTTVSFLKAVSPRYAVISVGAGNDYGHPAPETSNRLATQGAEIYRTDIAGTIVATSDGDVVKLDKSASAIKPQAPPVLKGSSNDDVIVYITRTGEKYHRDGCRYLAKSKIPIKLADAKSRGYTPCKVCQPPW